MGEGKEPPAGGGAPAGDGRPPIRSLADAAMALSPKTKQGLSPMQNRAGSMLIARRRAFAESVMTATPSEMELEGARSDAARRRGLQRVNSNFKAIVEGKKGEYDSLKKRRAELGELWYMIHPLGIFRVVWDLCMLCFVVYITLTMPYQLGFDAEPSPCSWRWPAAKCEALAVFERLVDYFFMTDLVLNFVTGYVESTGAVVMWPGPVAKNYLRGWFMLDFVSSAPFDALLAGKAFENLNSARLLKIGRLLKCMKMMRIGKVIKMSRNSGVADSMEEFLVSRYALAFGRVVAVILSCGFICHLMACFMAMSGPGFLRRYSVDFRGCDEDDMYADHECAKSAEDWPARRRYLAALYWAMSTMTTVGYGDITPDSDGERAYAIIGMVIGGGYYGYVIGIIATLVAVSDANARAYNEKMGVVNAWLEFNDLPRDLRRKVRAYFKTFLAEKSALDEQAILNDLDPGLRAELGQHLIPDAVRASHLFSGLPPTVLAKLSSLLRPVPAAVGDVLQVRGTHGVTMHVVVAGAVELSSDEEAARLLSTGQAQLHASKAPPGAYSPAPQHTHHSPHGCSQPNPESPWPSEIRPRVARAGETFGELVVLDLAASYAATAVACEPTALYMIEQASLYERFRDMPEVLNKMRHRADLYHKDGVYAKLPEKDENGDIPVPPRAKNMRSSLVGGGSSTLPAGFADTMLTLLSDVQQRLGTLDHRLDAMDHRLEHPDEILEDPVSPKTPASPYTPRRSLPADVLSSFPAAAASAAPSSAASTPGPSLAGADAEHWAAALRTPATTPRPGLARAASSITHSSRRADDPRAGGLQRAQSYPPRPAAKDSVLGAAAKRLSGMLGGRPKSPRPPPVPEEGEEEEE